MLIYMIVNKNFMSLCMTAYKTLDHEILKNISDFGIALMMHKYMHSLNVIDIYDDDFEFIYELPDTYVQTILEECYKLYVQYKKNEPKNSYEYALTILFDVVMKSNKFDSVIKQKDLINHKVSILNDELIKSIKSENYENCSYLKKEIEKLTC